MSGRSADSFYLCIDPCSYGVTQVRADLRQWLRTNGVPPIEEVEILTATGEAVANAIEHPLRPTSAHVTLNAINDAGTVRITVRDHGQWQPERQRTDGGYGLKLMNGLMDTVELSCEPDGTTIILTRQIGSGVSGESPCSPLSL